MTIPPMPEDRFAALWTHVRHLEDRIAAQEMWRAKVDAVSAWRRWALPTAVMVAGLVLTILNLFVLPH